MLYTAWLCDANPLLFLCACYVHEINDIIIIIIIIIIVLKLEDKFKTYKNKQCNKRVSIKKSSSVLKIIQIIQDI